MASDLLGFIELAKDYLHYSTDAPIEFGEVTAIQTLGFALGSEVYHLIQPEKVYHNSYVALIGPSTFARKDTIQKLVGSDIVPQIFHLTKESSPEAFLEQLSEQNQGIQYMGEWSKELKGIKSGNYMATFAEVKNDLFGCNRYHRRLRSKNGGKTKNEFIIEEPYLCVHTTITPEVLKEKLTTEMAVGGYFARHLIVSGELHTKKRGRLSKQAFTIKRLLQSQFEFVLNLGKSNTVFELSDEALKYYNDFVEEEALSEEFECVRSNAGRYLNYVLSFADILLVNEALGKFNDLKENVKVSNLVKLIQLVNLVENIEEYETNFTKTNTPTNLTNPNTPNENVLVVQKRHVVEAWRIIKKCLVTAKELVEYVDMEKELARVREYLRKRAGNWISHSVLLRNTNVSGSRKFQQIIQTLSERKELEKEIRQVPRQNKTTANAVFYRWKERRGEL